MHNFYHSDNITDLSKLREVAVSSKGMNTIHLHKHGDKCDYYKHEIYIDGEQVDERPSIQLRD